MAALKNKTVVITGGSRGIGREIALRCAKDGANIAILAKTAEPNPKLPGTIYTVAEEIKALGAKVLPIQIDLREDAKIKDVMEQIANEFGGIDILVNNASALFPLKTMETEIKRFDLMFGVNVRGTFACSQAAIPYLKKAENPHVLTISPPINLNPKWLAVALAYTMSKYGMSMCTLGMSKEFARDGIAFNSLWPKYVVDTIAVKNNFPGQIYEATLKPTIMSDAAYIILTSDSKENTGNFYLDEDLLKAHGMKDLSAYLRNPNAKPQIDFYIDE